MADTMSAGGSFHQVVQAVLDAMVENVLEEDELFQGVLHHLNQPVTESYIVYVLGWLSGLADACDRGIPRRIA